MVDIAVEEIEIQAAAGHAYGIVNASGIAAPIPSRYEDMGMRDEKRGKTSAVFHIVRRVFCPGYIALRVFWPAQDLRLICAFFQSFVEGVLIGDFLSHRFQFRSNDRSYADVAFVRDFDRYEIRLSSKTGHQDDVRMGHIIATDAKEFGQLLSIEFVAVLIQNVIPNGGYYQRNGSCAPLLIAVPVASLTFADDHARITCIEQILVMSDSVLVFFPRIRIQFFPRFQITMAHGRFVVLTLSQLVSFRIFLSHPAFMLHLGEEFDIIFADFGLVIGPVILAYAVADGIQLIGNETDLGDIGFPQPFLLLLPILVLIDLLRITLRADFDVVLMGQLGHYLEVILIVELPRYSRSVDIL